MRIFLFLIVFLACFGSGAAYADCTSPAGLAGTMDYNSDNSRYEFCDGTNWQSMKDTTGSVVWLDGGSGKRYYNGGNVGIGTADPEAKLSVSAIGDQAKVMQLGIERSWCFMQEGAGASTALKLNSDCGGSNNNKDFIIETNGQIGIGTTSPAQKLDVVGAVRAEYFSSTASNNNDVILKYEEGYGGIKQISQRGALSITSKDDSIYIGNGDVARTVNSTYLNPEAEDIGFASDDSIYFFTDLQEGWGTHHTMRYDNAGNLNLGGGKIQNLATPTAGADAATKAYVDANAGGGGALGQNSCSWVYTDTCGHGCGAGASKTAVCPVGKYVAGFGVHTWNSNGRYHTRVYCCSP